MTRGILIINADDLGQDANANQRILECLHDGLITSATIMANMPGFEDAARHIVENRLQDHIGVHLNFDTGPALSPKMRSLAESGNLKCGRELFIRDRGLRDALPAEARAQVKRCIEAGLRPTHFDSHHHLHTHFSVLLAVLQVAREFKVPYVRLAGNLYFPKGAAKQAYRLVINSMIRMRGLAGTRYFTYLDRFMPHTPQLDRNAVTELMVHPALDAEFQLLHSPEFDSFRSQYTLISYGERAKSSGVVPSDR